MSNHIIKFHKDLISSFLVILLTDRQTDTGKNITFLVELITCNLITWTTTLNWPVWARPRMSEQWILLQQVIMEVAVVTTTSPKSCKNSVYHLYKHDQHSALKSFYRLMPFLTPTNSNRRLRAVVTTTICLLFNCNSTLIQFLLDLDSTTHVHSTLYVMKACLPMHMCCWTVA